MRDEAFYESPDGLRIWHGLVAAGEGPALVLCDGIACDGFIWPFIIDHFSQRLPTLRWHYRGHGRSQAPPDDDGLRLECLVGDLHGILEARQIGSAVVVGHSMGVQVALEFYRRHPSRAVGLVLMCGAHGNPLSTFQGTSAGERALPMIRAFVERAPRLANAVWSRLVPTDMAFRIAQRTEIHPTRVRRVDFLPYLKHVARMDLRVFLGMLSQAAAHSAEDVLETIRVPTLVVGGGSDGFTPSDLSRRMAEKIPGAELLLLDGATHTAPLEFPDEINDRLGRFLVEHGLMA